MSTDATIWAWKQRDLSPSQKLVLLTMADRANEEHRCWPSNVRMQADTGLDRKTIYGCIADMEKKGLLRVFKSTGCRNVYELIGVQGREDCDQTSPKNNTSAESGTSPKNGQQPVPKTDRDQSQKRDTESKRESKTNLPQGESAQARTTPAQVEDPLPGKAGSKGKAKETGADATKQPFGEFGNVMLTATEHARLVQDYGAEEAEAAITFLDLHLGARKGSDPYKSHYLAMRKWVFQKLAEDRRKLGISKPAAPAQSGKSFNELTKQYRKAGGE